MKIIKSIVKDYIRVIINKQMKERRHDVWHDVEKPEVYYFESKEDMNAFLKERYGRIKRKVLNETTLVYPLPVRKFMGIKQIPYMRDVVSFTKIQHEILA